MSGEAERGGFSGTNRFAHKSLKLIIQIRTYRIFVSDNVPGLHTVRKRKFDALTLLLQGMGSDKMNSIRDTVACIAHVQETLSLTTPAESVLQAASSGALVAARAIQTSPGKFTAWYTTATLISLSGHI